MAVAGDIKVVMTLDDNDFTVKVKNSGKIIRDLTQDMKKAAESTKNIEKHITSLTSSFHGSIQTLGMIRFAIYDLRDAFGATILPIIKASAEIERMTKLMQGLSLETDKQAKKMDAVKNRDFVFNMAQNAPFEVKALTDTFIKLKSAGIDPTNGSMQTLVDSVAKFGGSSDILHRASIAIQQMAGKGVISMEELRQQLGEAIPNAMQAMAVGSGMSMAELNAHVKKGEVESISALDRMMAVLREWNTGAAAAMMDTWTGQFEKLKTQFTLFANTVGNGGVFEQLKASLKELNAWFNSSAAQDFGAKLSSAMSKAVTGVQELTKFLYDNWTIIKTIGEALVFVWAGSKLFSAINTTKALVNSVTEKYVAAASAANEAERLRVMVANQTSQQIVTLKRAEVAAMGEANAKKIISDNENIRREIAANQAKHTALMAEHNQYYAMYQTADKVATTGRLANGKFASIEEKALQKEIALSYFQRSMAAEKAAVATKAAEMQMRASIVDTTVALKANMLATQEGLVAIGTASKQTAASVGILDGALALLGGPIGALTTLLTLGAFAWWEWGNKSKEAIDKANYAIKNGMGTIEDYLTKQTELAQKRKDIAALEARLAEDAKLSRLDPAAYTPGMLKKKNEELAQLKRDELKIIEDGNKALAQSEKNSLNASVRMNQDNVQEQLDIITNRATKEEDIWTTKLNKREIDNKTYSERLGAIAVKKWADEIDVVDRSLKIIESKMATSNDKNKKAYQAQYDNLTKMHLELQNNLASAQKIGTSPDIVTANTPTSGLGNVTKEDNRTPLTKFVDKINEDTARLREASNDAKGELAKFDAMVANDEFKYKVKVGKNQWAIFVPTEEELAVAKKAIQDKMDAALKNKEVDKILADSASARDKIATLMSNANIQMQAADDRLDADSKNAVTRRMQTLKQQLELIKESITKAAWFDGPEGDKAREALSKIGDFTTAVLGTQAKEESSAFILAARTERKKFQEEAIISNREVLDKQFNDMVQAKYKELMVQVGLEGQTAEQIQLLWAEYYKWVESAAKAQQVKIRTPLQKLGDDWRDITTQMQNATVGWANSAVDAFVQFTKTGKMNFSSLIDSILTDILRMQTQKMFAETLMPLLESGGKALAGLFGFANGGIMTSDGPMQLRKYASGGIANSPQLAMYGEGSMNEAYVPLPDGKTIPVTMNGNGGGSNVVVNVYEAPGTKGTVNQTKNQDGSFSIDIIIEQIEGKMAKNVAAGRGSLSGAMEKTYGLNRAMGAVR